jgi:hypothetical protein
LRQLAATATSESNQINFDRNMQEKKKEVTSNTKRSENSSQVRMKRRRRISFILRERDEILTVHFISYQIESAAAT